MQPASFLSSKASPAFKPFSSPGTPKGSARCKCSTSLLVAPSSTEEDNFARQQTASAVVSKPSGAQPTKGATGLNPTGELNNILPRSQLVQTPSACSQNMQAKLPGKPGPGRPKGTPAWNKGRCMSEAVKERISTAQKQRWKKQPELRATMSSKLQGKEPWNKGLELSNFTRHKMSIAKLGSTQRVKVRNKMRRAHKGLRHTEASKAVMSAAHAGVRKSLRHKMKIAAAQRRRHAARRILTAVEAFHRGTDAAPAREPELPSTKPSKGKGKPVRGRGMKTQCLSNSQSNSLTRTQVMTAYKAELHEYRALQEELGPWTQAFRNQHGRKPGLKDVEQTAIPWLMEKFKAYVFLRDRLLSDTTILRNKLEGAAPEVNATQSSAYAGKASGLKAASYSTKLNANAASAQRSKASSAASLTAAMEYRRQQQALADTAAVSASATEAAVRADSALADAGPAAPAGPADNSKSAVPNANGSGGSSRLLQRRLQQNGVGAIDQQARQAAVNGTQDGVAAALGAQRVQHAESNSNGAQQPDASSSGSGPGSAPQASDSISRDSSVLAASSGAASSNRTAQANGLHQNGSQLQGSQPAPLEAGGKVSQNGSEGALQEVHQNSKSEADAAMAAALESIRAQKPPGKPLLSGGPRAIPTPTPNTSPRIKNALLAAQEYRKQKAAKTAALAVAAAKQAAEGAKSSDSQKNGSET